MSKGILWKEIIFNKMLWCVMFWYKMIRKTF